MEILMTKKLTLNQIQDRIDNIESQYYKGHKQTEYWWRISGDVHPQDRRLWTYYHNLKNKRNIIITILLPFYKEMSIMCTNISH